MASAGEYDDFREWPIRAFHKKVDADSAAAVYEETSVNTTDTWREANDAIYDAYNAAIEKLRRKYINWNGEVDARDAENDKKFDALGKKLQEDLDAHPQFPALGGEDFFVVELELL